MEPSLDYSLGGIIWRLVGVFALVLAN